MSESKNNQSNFWRSGLAVGVYFTVFKLLIHFIFNSNYGEAGAIDFFGGKYNLPKAISGHQSYFLWGPRDYTGEILIVLGSKKEDAEKSCQSVEEKTEVNHPYSMAEEKYKIIICRRTKKPLPDIWPSLKHWN